MAWLVFALTFAGAADGREQQDVHVHACLVPCADKTLLTLVFFLCSVQVQLMDISSKTCMFSVMGPQADAVMQQLQAGGICGTPYGTHTLLSFRGGHSVGGCAVGTVH